MQTKLSDRTLWYDGDYSIDPSLIESFLSWHTVSSKLHVTKITPDIQQFNKLNNTKISIKNGLSPLQYEWNIPQSYKELNITEYVLEKLIEKCESDCDFDLKKDRTIYELSLYKERDLINLLKTLIYVVETMEQNQIVWGVGRGSSVSSFVLYLIGVHDVDSVLYDLDINEFLK